MLYGSIPPPTEAAAKTPAPKEEYVIPQKNCVRWGTPAKQLLPMRRYVQRGRGLVCGGVVATGVRVCYASGLAVCAWVMCGRAYLFCLRVVNPVWHRSRRSRYLVLPLFVRSCRCRGATSPPSAPSAVPKKRPRSRASPRTSSRTTTARTSGSPWTAACTM